MDWIMGIGLGVILTWVIFAMARTFWRQLRGRFLPGQFCPDEGIYRSNRSGRLVHMKLGHRFPPCPKDGEWVMIVAGRRASPDDIPIHYEHYDEPK